MTYLQLINAVLTRLRENTIEDVSELTNNPYYAFIGSAVNDAKDRVEDAWQWGALRTTDAIELGEVGPQDPNLTDKADAVYEIPGTEPERHFILRGAWFQKIDPAFRPTKPSDPVSLGAVNGNTIYPARQLTIDGWIQRRMNQDKIPEGQPSEFSIVATNPVTGNLNVAVNVVPELDAGEPVWQLVLYSVRHQETLVNNDDRLLVPSLPVYTLATALASRERGEVGGTPVSELFAIADSHLSDAIAQDSALYQYDTDWTAGYRWNRTNFRTA